MARKNRRYNRYFASIYIKNRIDATVYTEPTVELYTIGRKQPTIEADYAIAKSLILNGNLQKELSDISFISSSDFYKISPKLCQSFPSFQYFIETKLPGIFSDLKLLQKYVSHLTRLRSGHFKNLNYEPEYLFYGNILKFIKAVRKEAYKRNLSLFEKFACLIGNAASLDKDIYEILQYTDFVQHPNWYKFKHELEPDFIEQQKKAYQNKINEVTEIFLEVVAEKVKAFYEL